MLGAIIGDIAGSIYEFDNIKTKDFKFFGKGATYTDDSILTIATADWLLNGGNEAEYYAKYANEIMLRSLLEEYKSGQSQRTTALPKPLLSLSMICGASKCKKRKAKSVI